MMASSRCALGALLLASLTPATWAQIVVDPTGGGHFTDLQTAIDTVAPGTTLRVVGGTYGPLVIPKSLTIVGDPAPTITSPSTGPGPLLPAAISLQGGGGDRLVLSKISVTGTVDGFIYGFAMPAISGGGFVEVQVLDSTVHGPEWRGLTGSADGVSAIDVTGNATVLIARSNLRASRSESDIGSGAFPPDGAFAVRAETVIVLDSAVTGGVAGATEYFFNAPAPVPCPCPGFSGTGGTAVEATNLYDAGSVLLGGAGSTVGFSLTGIGPYWPWGSQPQGVPFDATKRVQLDSSLFAFGPPQLGTTYTVHLSPSPRTSGFMILGPMAVVPTPLFGSLFFLELGGLYGSTPIAMFQWNYQIAIPAVAALGGVPLSFQSLLIDQTLSNPVATVIVF